VFALAWGAGAASAQPSPTAAKALTNALSSGMAHIGGASGAYVLDLTTGQTLYSNASTIGRMPASVEKLYTTSTALLEFGPTATFTTSVWGVGSATSSGVWNGTLYLKGGGDPTFGSAGFDRAVYRGGATVGRLVSNLINTLGISSIQGGIAGDGSIFDSLRGTPATRFRADLPDVEGLLSGLVFNRGFGNFIGSYPQRRPVLFATQQFAVALRAAGVGFPRSTPIYTARAPATATQLATVNSPTIARLIQLTNAPSDNYLAETLLKDLGARFGGAGTTAAGVAVVQQELMSKFGIAPRFNDGSGLSRADATTPLQVVTLLKQMYSNPYFFNSLAVAGESGTLQHEARGTAAQGVCHAKTGTLHDVADLAGYCQARDGHELAFAFLANRIGSPAYVHMVEASSMAAALARYNG
jgi:D-alanyl-D-alanine carboxypeptidase/D-alanyl-D-alanine-endopeptidase (penicillin-binding protein 4)